MCTRINLKANNRIKTKVANSLNNNLMIFNSIHKINKRKM